MSSSAADRTHPNLTLAVLALGGMAYALLSSAVVPALPTMQHDLGTSETGITWLLTGYLLAASVGTSILGRLGDMYGKERLLLWTLVILAAWTLKPFRCALCGPKPHKAHRSRDLASAAGSGTCLRRSWMSC